MKIIIFLGFLIICSPVYPVYADINTPTEFTEEDGSPSVFQPHKVKFSNGSVTDNSDGTVSVAGGSGETNTASNLGNGIGWFASKSGVDLRFKSIASGDAITITQDAASVRLSITGNGVNATQIDETADYSFTTLSGKQDRNNSAVNDDDCTGEQGFFWYDTTDSAFEFCNSNSGAPTVLGGGHKVFLDLPVQSASLSNDSTVRIDNSRGIGSTPYLMPRLLFADGINNPSSNIALYSRRLDDNWTGGALSLKINNLMISSDSTSTSDGKITYCASIWALTSGDAVTVTTESYDSENCKTQTVPSVMSRDETVSIPITNADSIAAGDWFFLKIRRDGSDSITGDSCVIALSLME